MAGDNDKEGNFFKENASFSGFNVNEHLAPPRNVVEVIFSDKKIEEISGLEQE